MKHDKNIIVKLDDSVQLPHNVDLERDVLGSIIILGEQALSEVEQYLTPDTFYTASHKAIYSAISSLNTQRKPIDTYSLATEMHAAGTLNSVGGAVYLTSLTKDIASTAYLSNHAKQLRQMEIQRGLFLLSERAKAMSIDPSIEAQETIETVEKGLTELQMHTKSSAQSMDQSIERFYNWITANSEHTNAPISTGLAGLDNIINGGFKAPDLVVIGGRPSMGKTQFLVHFARAAAEQGKYVLLVSIEMTTEQLVARMVARDGISYSKMRRGCLSPEEWRSMDDTLAQMAGMRINIIDSPDCRNLSYIKSEARRLKRMFKLDMIGIDYLGLVRTNQHFEKRYIEVGYITGELKALAKELDVPIILLSQLNRPSNGQEKQAPNMESLRESGDIEQDADIIIFPHRPYVYDSQACDETGRSWANRGMLLVPKNREGERNVKTYFMNDQQFKNFWDDEEANAKLSKH